MIKLLKIKEKEKILKAVREMIHCLCGKTTRMTADLIRNPGEQREVAEHFSSV